MCVSTSVDVSVPLPLCMLAAMLLLIDKDVMVHLTKILALTLQQLMNKDLAMKLLKSKLLAIAQQQKAKEIQDIKGGMLWLMFVSACAGGLLDEKVREGGRDRVKNRKIPCDCGAALRCDLRNSNFLIEQRWQAD